MSNEDTVGADDLRSGADDLMVLLTSALGEAMDETADMHNPATEEVLASIWSGEDNRRVRNLLATATGLIAVWSIDRYGPDITATRRDLDAWIEKWEERNGSA